MFCIVNVSRRGGSLLLLPLRAGWTSAWQRSGAARHRGGGPPPLEDLLGAGLLALRKLREAWSPSSEAVGLTLLAIMDNGSLQFFLIHWHEEQSSWRERMLKPCFTAAAGRACTAEAIAVVFR
jgi:hypothetical protein